MYMYIICITSSGYSCISPSTIILPTLLVRFFFSKIICRCAYKNIHLCVYTLGSRSVGPAGCFSLLLLTLRNAKKPTHITTFKAYTNSLVHISSYNQLNFCGCYCSSDKSLVAVKWTLFFFLLIGCVHMFRMTSGRGGSEGTEGEWGEGSGRSIRLCHP